MLGSDSINPWNLINEKRVFLENLVEKGVMETKKKYPMLCLETRPGSMHLFFTLTNRHNVSLLMSEERCSRFKTVAAGAVAFVDRDGANW